MTGSRDQLARLRRVVNDADARPLYEAVGGELLAVLTDTFHVPADDAQALLYEAFIAYHAQESKTLDARAWLIHAVCTQARTYLQLRGLPAVDPDRVEESLLTRLAIEGLPRIAREALRLRFGERKSYEEIANELGVSTHAANRIVGKAMAKLRGEPRPK